MSAAYASYNVKAMYTKKLATIIVFNAMALVFPAALLAQTNCDNQAKPAIDCPTGYSMMCIPVGGDHWGCGKEDPNGSVVEAPPTQSAGGALDPAAGSVAASSGTAAAPEPALQNTKVAPVTAVEPATAPSGGTAATEPVPTLASITAIAPIIVAGEKLC